MVYCVSDIHGELSRWHAILERISFSEHDTLYVIGDVIDRKPYGIEILRDIMQRHNVRMILGNHEQLMLDAFRAVNPHEARTLWKQNGGSSTYKTMVYRISREERFRILQYVQRLPDHLEIEVNGRSFHLVHGNVGENRHDRIWGRPEPPPVKPPIPGKTVIVGHTCTYFMRRYDDAHDPNAPFEIYHAPGLIDLDCGCGNNTDLRRLACLRLDDMQVFYV